LPHYRNTFIFYSYYVSIQHTVMIGYIIMTCNKKGVKQDACMLHHATEIMLLTAQDS